MDGTASGKSWNEGGRGGLLSAGGRRPLLLLDGARDEVRAHHPLVVARSVLGT
jgi:hypothetical protein